MSLLTLLNRPGQGTYGSDLPDFYLEWSPTTGPRETPVWERIPLSDIRSIDINRGRNRELDRFQAGRMSVVLDNRLRRYDPQLGAPAQYIDLPGTSGNYASTPDSAAVSITGDIDIRVRVAMDDWTPAAESGLLGKWTTAGNQRSYEMTIKTGGQIGLRSSVDGIASTIDTQSASAVGATDGSTKWVRITLDVDNGAAGKSATFYTSDDGSTWTQLGGTVTSAGTTSIFDSTAPVEIGGIVGGTIRSLAGNVYYAEVRNGINGPVVAKFDPNTVPQQATRTPNAWVADTTGETWTVNGSAWNWGGSWGTPHSGNVKPMKRIRLRAVWDTTYDLFSGFVDSWDQDYDHTNEAICTVTADDLALGDVDLPSSVWVAEINEEGSNVSHWFRFTTPVSGSDIVDVKNRTVVGTATTSGSALPTLGATSLIAEDPDGAATFENATDNQSFVVRGPTSIGVTTANAFTIECVCRPTADAAYFYKQNQGPDLAEVSVFSPGGTNTLRFRISNGLGTSTNADTTIDVCDGSTHHVVCVYNANGAGSMQIYIDGTDRTSGSPTYTGSTIERPSQFGIGGAGDLPLSFVGFDGVMDDFVIYNGTALSPTRITAHSEAVFAPWNGDTTGERLNRIFDISKWPTAERDIDTGDSTLQSAALGTTVIGHAQLVRDTEYGELFVLPNGSIRFIGRQNRWKPPYNDPIFTLSDDGSDLGYGRLKFNYDKQLIRNNVTIGYENGLTHVVNSTGSQDDFLVKSYSLTGLIGDVDLQGIDYANYIVGRYDEPLLRVEGISITPQKDPATMWPAVLAADLVYQVNVERTPQGVGSAIDIDYTIEGVSHHITPKFWRTELQLSPADTPGALILDSTSQGILDTHTLGW